MTHQGRLRIAAWTLAISYGIGAPLTALAEYRSGLFSQRFDLSPQLLYGVAALQVACAVGVLVSRFARWAAACLTVITLGAIASHLRIGSPLTALPAMAYTGLQVWFALTSRAPPGDRSAGGQG